MNTGEHQVLSERKFSELCSVLGVTKQCCLDPDRRVIEKAFRRNALKCHPDKGGDPVVFKRLNDAYYKLIGHILKLQQQSELLELSQSILIEISRGAMVKWQEKLRTRYGWFKSDSCKHIIFDITVVLYEDPPDQIPKIHVRSRKYMAWIAENALPVHLHVVDKVSKEMTRTEFTDLVQGRPLQFDQWRIVHLAEFGIVNFSEVSPSSFNKKSQSDSSPKDTERRKAREEAEECPEVKPDLGQTEDSEVEDNDRQDGSEGDAEPDPAEQPTFVCSTCGERFVSQMSLHLHRNSCVPDDFYDEFPADIIENGDLPFRKGTRSKVIEDSTDHSPSTPGTATTATSCITGSSTANELKVEDNSEDETKHSGEIFNEGEERQETVESRERETKGELDDSVPDGGNLNVGDAESEAELHSWRAEIDRSSAEGPAKTDRTQIHEHFSETSQGEQSKGEEKHDSHSLNEEILIESDEKTVTNPTDQAENEEMPKSFAFKQDRDLPSLQSAQQLMETNPDEEAKTLVGSEAADVVEAMLAVEDLDSSFLALSSCYLQSDLLWVGDHQMITRPVVTVTAVPRRERMRDTYYPTYNKCTVLTDKEEEVINNNIIQDLLEKTRIMEIMEQQNVEKKLRDLELEDDIRPDGGQNENMKNVFTRPSNYRSRAEKLRDELDESISVGGRKIVLSNTEVNKNRPKLLGPSRFGY